MFDVIAPPDAAAAAAYFRHAPRALPAPAHLRFSAARAPLAAAAALRRRRPFLRCVSSPPSFIAAFARGHFSIFGFADCRLSLPPYFHCIDSQIARGQNIFANSFAILIAELLLPLMLRQLLSLD